MYMLIKYYSFENFHIVDFLKSPKDEPPTPAVLTHESGTVGASFHVQLLLFSTTTRDYPSIYRHLFGDDSGWA